MSTETTQPETAEIDENLTAADTKYKQLEEEFLRFRAETENHRKRLFKDIEAARKFGAEKLLAELVPVADTLERGVEIARSEKATLENLREGKEATLRILNKILENNGVSTIDPLDQPFNPDLHQAMSTQPRGEKPANTVLIVLQKGYLLNERLIRPALVIVAAD